MPRLGGTWGQTENRRTKAKTESSEQNDSDDEVADILDCIEMKK